jgi:hypothetical protein
VLSGERNELQPVEASVIEASSLNGQPMDWCVDGSNLAFERPADQAYSLVLRYRGDFALSDASPTNDLLTRAPDIYLWGTICEAAPYLRDADFMATAEGKFQRAVKDFNAAESRSKAPAKLRTELGALQNRSGYNIMTDR